MPYLAAFAESSGRRLPRDQLLPLRPGRTRARGDRLPARELCVEHLSAGDVRGAQSGDQGLGHGKRVTVVSCGLPDARSSDPVADGGRPLPERGIGGSAWPAPRSPRLLQNDELTAKRSRVGAHGTGVLVQRRVACAGG